MKTIILLLIGTFAIACSTQKVLKTDTNQDIDLSGRWNNTDAEIASNKLYNSLIGSTWLKEQQAKDNFEPRIEILSFESNFKDEANKLSQYFTQYIRKDSAFELIGNESEKAPDFQLSGEIMAEEFITESQNYIDYRLTAQLKNMKGEIQWEDNTVIKKYIKN
ncbi:Peptidoglycan-synthase activator LpoB [Marivirga sericea]|uniref:Peptidoglycan-synthase activator LpoB n=1 Tax=Marivirga sericea TaxID=1028 RepID=A0A1X7IE86_9BACT|nr:hypothetical protein [Marivirga sericea]SMG12496.1 Peptidoglycan-synthase activator LpoB [Marivirga sericea]